ncbi:DNA-binding LacI/PurR family transcriptional regulator [Arthrobacter silviterrae]|uniref:LacI family transcriptional regulator n=1 Tax=Arthrobacter silviterrae TaxID=2026658 RepID=A0ABX0D9J4_9MICC|nr:LacI family DNA-binding transcriptional regulator [Arthrobacter silviterrae]MDQ0278594.1 DNA-binding LacI/PurR family transcriptional regulator [Arthrobacter silviterrae]NGN82150.1 LacI family transcriptional regulator [Arthrobacter silviterrae]
MSGAGGGRETGTDGAGRETGAGGGAGKVTIAGLAARLGLSKASVSYALNGQPGVSGPTRARVLALAAELGWYPSSSARALSQSRSDAVGIVLARSPEEVGSESFYMNVLAGIEAVLSDHDLNLVLRMVTPEADPGTRRDLAVYRRWAGEGRVGGVIVFDHVADDPRLQLLAALRLPHVLVGAAGDAARTAYGANTTVDQGRDAATVVDALHRLGHRHFAYVSGPMALTHETARWAGLLAAAGRLGMTAVTSASDYTADDGGKATTAVIAGLAVGSPEFPTAVVYGNDLMAVGGLQALKRLGVPVPAHVSALSWDDSLLCQLSSPGVAALARNTMELGRRSAALLLDVMDGHRAADVAMPAGALMARESLGPAPQ